LADLTKVFKKKKKNSSIKLKPLTSSDEVITNASLSPKKRVSSKEVVEILDTSNNSSIYQQANAKPDIVASSPDRIDVSKMTPSIPPSGALKGAPPRIMVIDHRTEKEKE